MSRRSIRIAILAAAAFAAAAPLSTTRAQDADNGSADPALKEVENSKFSTSGIVSSNAVYVRCGPGDNYYPTMKLDKGARVKVVGAKFDWLKIVPPDGSFCYVARLYVDRHGDGKVGRVNKDSINVRAGSSLSALKIGILCELAQGEEVEILGEEQEYFRIKPPAKAFLYVAKKFVEPDPDAKPEIQTAKTEAPKPPAPVEAPKPAETPTASATTPQSSAPFVNAPGADFGTVETPKPAEAPKPVETPKPEVSAPVPAPVPKADAPKPDPIPQAPATVETPKPETTPAPTEAPRIETPKVETPKIDAPPVVEAPKPQPPKVVEAPKPAAPAKPTFPVPVTTDAAETAFGNAEKMFDGTRGVSLDQQPLDSLLAQYQAITKSDALPESLRRIADARLRTVQTRLSAQADLIKAKQGMDELSRRRQALMAEQAELQRRITENTVKIYQAVGTLQPSSLQLGKGVLYRLTDPATGRTVCYLRSDDPTQSTQINQFVGVKGKITEDPRLGAKVLIPTEVTACDPGKVHQTITAQIIPPSLMPKEPVQATAPTEPTPQQ